MKKIFSLILVLATSISLWASDIEIDGIYYIFDSNKMTATVTYGGSGYSYINDEYSGKVTIPETVVYEGETYTVTAIGEDAFRECSCTDVRLPKNITSIGDYAFYFCRSLLYVQFSDSLRSIGNCAFYYCETLPEVVLPDSLQSIGNNAFTSCSGLQSVTFPVNLRTLGQGVFNSCTSLKTIVWNARSCNGFSSDSYAPFKSIGGYIQTFEFGDQVETIPRYLCSGISGLKSITIPENVKKIESSAFNNVNNIEEVIWNARGDGEEEMLTSSPFYGSKDKIVNFTFGDNVKKIPQYLCRNLSQLTSVRIPDQVNTIGKQAFRSCSGLTAVELPESVETIGEEAFSGCSKLKSVVIPKNVKEIGNKAFYGITNLSEVVMLPETIVPHPEEPVFYDSEKSVPFYVITDALAREYEYSDWSNEFSNISSTFPYTINLESDPYEGQVEVTQEATWTNPFAIIKATATPGHKFTGWSDGNTDNPRTIDVLHYGERNITLGATFIAVSEVNFAIEGDGSAVMDVLLMRDGEVIDALATTVTAFNREISTGEVLRVSVYVSDYSFLRKWSDDKSTQSLERDFTINKNTDIRIQVDKKVLIEVRFEGGDGHVTGAGYQIPGNVTVEVFSDTEGKRFDHWENGSTDNPRTLSAEKDTTLTAYMVAGWDGHYSCIPTEGQGSSAQPYKIRRPCELLWYKQQVDENHNYYAILDDDISLDKNLWEPIGTEEHPFTGNFDGRNFTIKDFTVNADKYAGVFGFAQNARIENIKVSDATVKGHLYTGIICGYAENTDIIACDNFAVVEGENQIGGICGFLTSSSISNCNNEGEVKATGDYAGGVAGYLSNSSITECKNNKSVISTGQYIGGVAGYITGYDSKILTANSGKDATVKGAKYVGGLCGKVAGGAFISGSTNIGAVYGTDQEVGGVIGRLEGASAEKLVNYGRVTSTSSQVGGAIGSSKESTVSYCANSGMIVATENQNVGGLIGNADKTTILSCINTGVVRGRNYTGGLVGYFYNSSHMSYSANYGPVSGEDRVGGVTGESRAPMVECFSTGHVTGTEEYVGGITGFLNQDDFAEKCLFDNQLCPLDEAFGKSDGGADGEGIPTAELIGTDVSGFDKVAWTMKEGLYPVPSTVAAAAISNVAASVVLFAAGDNANNFSKDATLAVDNRATWTSKGGTQIKDKNAKPAIIGPDTLYVTKGNAVKAVPVRVTASAIPSYTLTINAGEHGRVDNAGGKFAEGTEVTVEAIADEGYHFLKWSDNSEENPRTFKVTKDETFTAYFEKDPTPTFTVTITAGAGGTVNSSVNGTHEQGEEIELIATANEGYRFVQWSDGNKVNPRKLIVTQDTTLEASFEEIPPTFYTLTIEASTGGHVDQDKAGTSFQEGSSVTLTAVPDEDFIFVQWEDGSTTNPRTIVINSDKTVKAQFAAIQYWNITVQAEKGGTVNDSVNTKRYKTGEKVLIEAKVNNPEDTAFVQWSDGVTENPRYVTIVSDTVITAQFAKIEYLHITLNAGEGGTVNDSVNTKRYKTGDKVRIEAKPDADHTFFMWSDQERENPRDITLTSDTTITAIFRAIPTYTLSISAGEGGTVNDTVNKTYREGTEVTIEAKADDNHKFYSWSDSIKTNPRKIVMTENITLKALFVEVQKATLWVGTTEGGTTNADKVNGKYEEGAQITVTATPARGFNFVRWSNGATSNSITVTMGTQDIILYPIFITRDCEEE